MTLYERFVAAFITGERWKLYISGLGITIEIALFAGILGIIIGTIVALMKLTTDDDGRPTVLSVIATIYVDIIRGSDGQDPASVVFDALKAARARNADILICDTAGRLHNKKNLMEELKKIHRIIDKEYPEAARETLVVIDGTTGQNALLQAREFHEAAEATGIIMTKLDGTAKGGIAVAVESELNIPVKYIGVGEGIDDFERFDPETFVDAMFASALKQEDEADDGNNEDE